MCYPTLLYWPILLVILRNVPPYFVISHFSVIWNSRVCHPVLTSPINQHEHISVNFYLKLQQLYYYYFFFSPAAAATWLSSRGCRLRPASPGLSEKVIQRWPLPGFMKDWLANWHESVRLMSDQYWSGDLGDIWFLYLFGGGNFFLYVIILTITRRETFGHLRSHKSQHDQPCRQTIASPFLSRVMYVVCTHMYQDFVFVSSLMWKLKELSKPDVSHLRSVCWYSWFCRISNTTYQYRKSISMIKTHSIDNVDFLAP